MTPVVRILIADDHEVVRAGLRALLEGSPGFEVCGEAGDGRDAVEKAAALKPDVVVLDLAMPLLNGLEATRQIVERAPRTEILILTVNESDQLVREVLRAGARGYVLKSDAGPLLIDAVSAVSSHKPFFTASVAELVMDGFLRGDKARAKGSAGALTPREREVLQLLAEGLANKHIAALLGISIKTVETHRAHVMAKLGVHSVTELVRHAIRHGIVVV